MNSDKINDQIFDLEYDLSSAQLKRSLIENILMYSRSKFEDNPSRAEEALWEAFNQYEEEIDETIDQIERLLDLPPGHYYYSWRVPREDTVYWLEEQGLFSQA